MSCLVQRLLAYCVLSCHLSLKAVHAVPYMGLSTCTGNSFAAGLRVISHIALQWGNVHWLGLAGAGTIAAYAITRNLSLAEADHYELFHIYYQPLLVMLAMLWLWALDVRAFEQHRIAYHVCFSAHDQQYLLSSQQLCKVCAASISTCITTPFRKRHSLDSRPHAQERKPPSQCC